MDSALQHSNLALNGLDILMWALFLYIAPKVLRFVNAKHPVRATQRTIQRTPQPASASQIKIAV